MVKYNRVREVVEDAVVGNDKPQCSLEFCSGYKSFQFPYTVSFESEGKYEVIIKGKKAIVRKVEE